MKDILFLVWQYLSFHKVKTSILVLSVTLILYLPTGLRTVVEQSAVSLTARAHSTPLVLGAKGSPLELVLNSLYFDSDVPQSIPYEAYTRLTAYNLALSIPLHTRYRTGQLPVIGTTLDYFNYRELKLAEGSMIAFLGDCVLGDKAARHLGASAGDKVMSSPENVFNLAGEYPLRMHVSGVLEPNGTADDEAVFVDIKTAWVIEGLAHGHQDLSDPKASGKVLKKEGNVVVGNASLQQYNEITRENMDSFHFHGDPDRFPISALIAIPKDDKSATLLMGKYLGSQEEVQIVKSLDVMNELLETIIKVQDYVIAAILVVGLSALSTMVLVFLLSLRIRKGEIRTMHRIGGSVGRIFTLLALEIFSVLLLGGILSLGLNFLTAHFGPALLKGFLLG